MLWEEVPVMVGPAGTSNPLSVLVTQRGCVYRDIVETEFLPGTPTVDLIQMGSVEAVKSGVISGLGSGVIPMVAANPWLRGGQLIRLAWQPSKAVVTEVRWNREVCPRMVVDYLEQLPEPRN